MSGPERFLEDAESRRTFQCGCFRGGSTCRRVTRLCESDGGYLECGALLFAAPPGGGDAFFQGPDAPSYFCLHTRGRFAG